MDNDVEVRETARRVPTFAYPAEVVVFAEGEEMIVSVSSPPFYVLRNPSYLGAIKDKNHAFLRPFRRFLEEGNPEIGKVWFLSLSTSSSDFVRALGSFVLTTGPTSPKREGTWLGHVRLLFFPGLGLGRLEFVGENGKREVKKLLDHYTIEEKGNGQLECHMTFLEEKKPKKKSRLRSFELKLWDEHAIHIATLCLRSPRALDRSGYTFGVFRVPNRRKDLEAVLRRCLVDNHPIIQLPEASELEPDCFLRIDILFTREGIRDREYPKPILDSKLFKKGPEAIARSKERLIRVPLKNGISLLLIVRAARGEPMHDILWITKDRSATRMTRKDEKTYLSSSIIQTTET